MSRKGKLEFEGALALASDGRGRVFAALRDGNLLVADAAQVGNTIDTSGAAFRTLVPSPPLGFEPVQLTFSRGEQFAAVAGPKNDGSEVYGVAILDVTDTVATSESEQSVASFGVGTDMFDQRPGLRPLQVSWHPDSNQNLGVLTSDNTWRLYNAQQPNHPEQTFHLAALQSQDRQPGWGIQRRGERAAAFAFGAQSHGWDRFSVHFGTSAGNLYTMCPVAPFGARYPGSLVQTLLEGCQGSGNQTAEAWLHHAFPGFYPHSEESLLQQRRSVSPHSLEDCTPALQGPLQSSSDGAQLSLPPVASLAVLHWESAEGPVTDSLETPQAACTVLVTAGPSGKIHTALLTGEAEPAWGDVAPKQWTDDYGHVVATRGQALAWTSESAPRWMIVDEIPVMDAGECDPDPDDGSDSDDETGACKSVLLMPDPVAGNAVYAAHELGVAGVSLPWLPMLADQLAAGALDEDWLPELPAPSVLDLSGDWGRNGLKGACLTGDSMAGLCVVVITLDGLCQKLPTNLLQDSPPSAQAVDAGQASGSATTFPSPGGTAMDTSRAALAAAATALESRYAWLLKGPENISISMTPGLKSGQIEGQRSLNSAISQMHKKYIEFSTQAHQFISHKVSSISAEAKRQTAQEAQLRADHDKAVADSKLLQDRVDRALKLNKNLQARFSLLTMLESSQPRPLSDKEEAFGKEELPMREEQVKEMERRLQALTARVAAMLKQNEPAGASTGPLTPARSNVKSPAPSAGMPLLQIKKMQDELLKVNSTVASNQECLLQMAAHLAKLNLALQ